MSDTLASSLEAMVDDFMACGLFFDKIFGSDHRNKAIALVNFAGNVMAAMGEDANDPEIVSKVAKIIAGERIAMKQTIVASHPKFQEDVQQYVELAKILKRRVPVTIEHN